MEEAKDKISRAVQLLITEDSWLIEKDLSEQCIAHKLAEKLNAIFDEFDVDCEYNGNCEAEGGKKRIDVLAQDLKELDKLSESEELEFAQLDHSHDLVYNRRVFPDIIIHKRKRNDKNHCIIELKKSTSNVSFEYDRLKLKAYTNNYYGNELNYKLGIFLIIKTGKDFIKEELEKNYIFEQYANGEKYYVGMGYKNMCLSCRKVFNQGTDFNNIRKSKCPDCSKIMIPMNHRFRAPKKAEIAKWKTVEFLIVNGFFYQHIRDEEIIATYVSYPENIREAKVFVEKYKTQALKPDQIESIMNEII